MAKAEAALVKNIAIIVPGTGDQAEVKEVRVHPGNTVGDVLRKVGLTGYHISAGQGQPLWDEADNLFALVEDGMKVWATPEAEQG